MRKQQLSPPSWSPRLFLPLEVPRPQLAGKRAIATGILRLLTMAVASAFAGLATGLWVGAVATDTERLVLAA